MIKIKNVLNILCYLVSLVGIIPLFPYIGILPKILFPSCLLAAIFLDRRERHPLRGIWVTVPTVAIFFWYASTLRMGDIATPFANLLVSLLAVRVVAEKNHRNYLQIFTLSLFSLAVTSLFTLTGFFLFFLLMLLILIAAALFLMTFSVRDGDMVLSKGELRKVLATSLLLPIVSLPLMLIFFIFLPRTQFPLWNVLKPPAATAGFSEKVDPGRSAAVGEQKAVAFRVETAEMPPENLYWRVTVLNTPVGKTWIRDPKVVEREVPYFIKGKAVEQVIYPELGMGDYLVALNMPRQLRAARVSQSGDTVFTNRWQTTKRTRYEALSVVGATLSLKTGIDRGVYLQLPENTSGRIRNLGKSFARKGRGDEERFSAVSRFYEEGGFSYATTDLPVGENAIDDFLFNRKKGNCEFFASSSALLLRAAGVPARLVGGYYGGEYNDLGGYYIVLQDRAHVWVEAYLEGKGWVTLDPSRFAVNASGAFASSDRGFKLRMQMMVDTVTYYWNQSVVNYDFERQLQFMLKAEGQLHSIGVKAGLKIFAAIAVLLGTATAAFFLAKRNWRRKGIQEKLLGKLLRKIHKKYPTLVITTSTGLYDLARAINDPAVDEFTAIYGTALYKERHLSQEDIVTLKALLRRM